MVTWPAQLDMERRDLPTEVVPIYLLAFLHAFELLGGQELRQEMSCCYVPSNQTRLVETLIRLPR